MVKSVKFNFEIKIGSKRIDKTLKGQCQVVRKIEQSKPRIISSKGFTNSILNFGMEQKSYQPNAKSACINSTSSFNQVFKFLIISKTMLTFY